MSNEQDKPTESRERTAGGRFAPGNRVGVGHGRPPKAREIEVFEAAARGAPAADIERMLTKMIALGIEGDVAAARLVCQVRGLIGREEPASIEAVEVAAFANLDPARVTAVLDELFAGSQGVPVGGRGPDMPAATSDATASIPQRQNHAPRTLGPVDDFDAGHPQ